MQADANQVHIEVFTFKEGLLSTVAHDLRLHAESVQVTASGGNVTAQIDLSRLVVKSAQKNGQDDDALSSGDQKKIQKSIAKDVLHLKRHPEASFSGKFERDGTSATVTGNLSLHGTTRPLKMVLGLEGERWTGETVIHQPDFGIKPFSAMLGALKVKPDITVRVSIDAALAG